MGHFGVKLTQQVELFSGGDEHGGRSQLQHPAKGRTAEVTIHRDLDRSQLLQRIGADQELEAVWEHDRDIGPVADSHLQQSMRESVHLSVEFAVCQGFPGLGLGDEEAIRLDLCLLLQEQAEVDPAPHLAELLQHLFPPPFGRLALIEGVDVEPVNIGGGVGQHRGQPDDQIVGAVSTRSHQSTGKFLVLG